MQQKKNITTLFPIFLGVLLVTPFLAQIALTSYNSASSLSVFAFAVPNRIQEGNHTNITVEIQATPNQTYTFRINVTNPIEDFSTVNLTVTTNATGFGSNLTKYWGEFQDANTNLVGTYSIFVKNMTTDVTLATANFTVGLTDKLEYQRTENVNIRGAGYNRYENASIDIKHGGTSVKGYPKNVTADAEGIVTDSWGISQNATPGTYRVSITNTTSEGTVKTPADVQDFEVLGVVCQIETRNLANQTIRNMIVEVYNSDVPDVPLMGGKTNTTGWIRFNLDVGNYTFKAFWKGVEVGAIPNVNATEDETLTLRCHLTNIKILVVDEAGNPFPLINFTANYNYTTRENMKVQGTESVLTSIIGIGEMQNMLTNISYLFKAQRYGHLFNETYIEEMKAAPWFNINITLPTHTAFIHVVDSKNNPVESVRVDAYEWSSGLGDPDQSETTNSNGNVTFSLSFGKYRVRVYKGDILLNENTIDLILNQSSFVFHLNTYNIDLTVTVIDYFGQPISKALVKVEQKTTVESVENTTGTDGRITFTSILGGDSKISVSIDGELIETEDLYLANAKQVTFKLNRYVVIAGYAVETSRFVTAIALAVLIAAFIVASTYKRLLKILTKSK